MYNMKHIRKDIALTTPFYRRQVVNDKREYRYE